MKLIVKKNVAKKRHLNKSPKLGRDVARSVFCV